MTAEAGLKLDPFDLALKQASEQATQGILKDLLEGELQLQLVYEHACLCSMYAIRTCSTATYRLVLLHTTKLLIASDCWPHTRCSVCFAVCIMFMLSVSTIHKHKCVVQV